MLNSIERWCAWWKEVWRMARESRAGEGGRHGRHYAEYVREVYDEPQERP